MVQRETEGLIHLYEGDGKGKTTAAVGLCVRMAGRGGKILFFQFLKSGESGEIGPLKALGVQVGHTPQGNRFTWQMSPRERTCCKAEIEQSLYWLKENLKAGAYDLVVLDEVLDAVNTGMMEEAALLDLLHTKAPKTELVLTGRDPSPSVQAMCHYISHIQCIQHPYLQGITARKGVEY